MLIVMPSGEQILYLLKSLSLPGSLYNSLMAYFERLPQMKSPEVFDTLCFAVADSVFSSRELYTVEIIHNSAEPDALSQMAAQSG